MHEAGGDNKWTNEPGEEEVQEWSSQDMGPPIFITLARIYDLLAVIAINTDPEAAGQVLALHEMGLLKGAMPSLAMPEGQNDPSDQS